MRRREYEEVSFALESGGVIHVRAKFKMMRLTANDRTVMSAIADAVQRHQSRTEQPVSVDAVDPSAQLSGTLTTRAK